MQIIILAGGKGKRMESDLPKVLIPFKGKPLIEHLRLHVSKSNLTKTPVIVVGHEAELVKKTFGDKYRYVYQDKQLGTGHAVLTAKKLLENEAEDIMVLYGDHPLVDAKTINFIGEAHIKNKNPITMATVRVDDFDDWRRALYTYGRVIRDEKGNITKIIELKDCSDNEKKIKEVNPSYFCFNAKWLWQNLEKLDNKNAQNEFYLTDLVGMAVSQSQMITTVNVDPVVALGANTKGELVTLESLT